jgi:preprotein translocase subunit YajC
MSFLMQAASLVLAQSEEAAPAQGPLDGIITFAGPVLMFVVIYFLLIRPANKQRRDHAALLGALKKDDEVVTQGGIIGRVLSIDEKLATLEIADKVKIRVLRDRIAGLYGATSTSQSSPQPKK